MTRILLVISAPASATADTSPFRTQLMSARTYPGQLERPTRRRGYLS
jgi:hypothetical protein